MTVSTVELCFSTEYDNSGENIIILFRKYLNDIWGRGLAKSFLGIHTRTLMWMRSGPRVDEI